METNKDIYDVKYHEIVPRLFGGMISVVIPVCNEEESINELYERLLQVLDSFGLPWEIIFVEDSSSDNTVKNIKKLGERDNRVKALFLTRGFGQHIAITAGLDYTYGDHIIIMDGDLQHRPEEISRMLELYFKGYEIVYGKRVSKQSRIKQMGSYALNYFSNLLSDSKININSSMFRVISKRVRDDICNMREVGRFITGMMSWLSYPSAYIEIYEGKRKIGKSKYSLFKSLNLFTHGIVSFSTKPLIFSTYIGFTISLITFIWGCVYLIYSLINGTDIPGYPSLILSIFFLAGMILFVLGIIGHYISLMFIQLQSRPLYVIRDTLNFEKK
jgi:dolichol-phosphate mannosyltransferase